MGEKDQRQFSLIRDSAQINCEDYEFQVSCYNWDVTSVSVTPEYDGLQYLLWRTVQDGTSFVCIDSVCHAKSSLVLFQDKSKRLGVS